MIQLGSSILDTIRVRFSWESDQSVFKNRGYRILLRDKEDYNLILLPDTTIDLVCIPIVPLLDSLHRNAVIEMMRYNYFATDEDYFEGRDVYVLGYPGSVGASYWIRGLLRKGIISWLPSRNIEGEKFLIDCNIYRGSSGGPVFSFARRGSVALGADTALFKKRFFGIVTQRRLNYNDVYSKSSKNEILEKNLTFLAPESIAVGVVEPAKNVLALLKHAEEILNRYEL